MNQFRPQRPFPIPEIHTGIVVHDPGDCIDGLLAEFALTIRSRGFKVAGFVQQNNRGGQTMREGCQAKIEYFDLRTSESIIVDRDSATALLRRVLGERADLLVVSRFASYVEATETDDFATSSGNVQGLSLLTSIPGRCLQKWHHFTQYKGAMIAPDPASIWSWWGPERLYQDLALGVAPAEVLQIVCGQRWIMVEGPNGTGLCYLPRPPQDLLPRLPHLTSLGLRGLARMANSLNPLEMAVGIAAINAHYNRDDLAGQAGNGTKALRKIPGQVGVVGAFPGLNDLFPHRAVIEADPKPGEFPLASMDAVLPGCAAVIVNSSALVNRTLPRIVRLAPGRPIALIGPSTPLTPRLHDYGISVLGGLVIDDAKGLANAIRAGALPREFSRFGRSLHITAD